MLTFNRRWVAIFVMKYKTEIFIFKGVMMMLQRVLETISYSKNSENKIILRFILGLAVMSDNKESIEKLLSNDRRFEFECNDQNLGSEFYQYLINGDKRSEKVSTCENE